MGMGDIIGALWKGYKAGTGAGDLGGLAVSVAGLEVAATQIEENQKSYINDKSASNVKKVKTNIINIRDYLRSLDLKAPTTSDMFSMDGVTKYEVSAAISSYASELQFKIDMAISSGDLPEIDDRPWSSRRAGYVRLRDGSRQMALQFEAVVRTKQKELTNITAYEARLLALAFSDDMTDADLHMIQADMNQQKADEDSTRRTLTIFSVLANGARRNYQHFSDIIDAGDSKYAKK